MENNDDFEGLFDNLLINARLVKGSPEYYSTDSGEFIKEFDIQIEEFRSNGSNYAKFQEEFEICVVKWEGCSFDLIHFEEEFGEEFEFILNQPFDGPRGYYWHVERGEVFFLELEKSKKECLRYMNKKVEKNNLEE